MKLVSKIAIAGALLVAGVSAASAQNTGRPSIDTPTRHWGSGLTTGPSYYGDEGGPYGYAGTQDYNDYGKSREFIWATPQDDHYNPNGN